MINNLGLPFVLGFLSVFLFAIFERIKFIAGKEMITDKFLSFLQKIYDRPDPRNSKVPEERDYHISDKVIVRKVYFNDKG